MVVAVLAFSPPFLSPASFLRRISEEDEWLDDFRAVATAAEAEADALLLFALSVVSREASKLLGSSLLTTTAAEAGVTTAVG